MRPVDVNGGIHTASKQHQRKNIRIYPPLASRVLCGLGLGNLGLENIFYRQVFTQDTQLEVKGAFVGVEATLPCSCFKCWSGAKTKTMTAEQRGLKNELQKMAASTRVVQFTKGTTVFKIIRNWRWKLQKNKSIKELPSTHVGFLSDELHGWVHAPVWFFFL